MSDKGEIVIIGAGLVGSLTACILQKKGFKVSVFERYPDTRTIPSVGRSINLVMTSRGLRATDSIGDGLREEILALGVPVYCRIIHQADGSVVHQPYGKDDSECNYSISRYELNKYLISKAEQAGAKLYFGHTLDEENTVFTDGPINNGGDVGCKLVFKVGDYGSESRQTFQCACPVIACDGGGSRARFAMKAQGLTDATETMLGSEVGSKYAYKEVLFPKDSGLESRGLHIWPRRKHMLMTLANQDGSMTGTFYMDSKGGEETFEALEDMDYATSFFEKFYPDAAPMVGGVNKMVEQMHKNPEGLLGTVRTTKWNHRGRVLLIGDAAHAICPFFGQGMNCGFEDVNELVKAIDKYNCRGGTVVVGDESVPAQVGEAEAAQWCRTFEEFGISRKPNGDAIADLALANFVEMQDKTADRSFLLMKRVENRIENAFTHKFRSGYAMVCYGGAGNVTYRNAQLLNNLQVELLQQLIAPFTAELEALPDDCWKDSLDQFAARVSMEDAEKVIDTKVVAYQLELGVDVTKVSQK